MKVTPLLATAIGLALATSALGCVRHVHHPAATKSVVVLDKEHDDGKIVVVKTTPARHRVCWKHRRHWHCRR